MKASLITRMTIQSSLLISLVSCSDSTQFAEKSLPNALEAAKAATTTETTDPTAEYNSTSPTAATGPSADGTSPHAAVAGGTGTGTGATATGTSAGGTGTGSTGTGTGGAASNPPASGEIFSECSAHMDKSIISQLYQLPAQTNKLPDFSTMTPVGDVCVSQLNIGDRDFTQGFPGVSDIFEWFALDMRFKVTIAAAGNYQFFLNSDDGSIMEVDGSKVIDNDGTHSQKEVSGSKYLAAGVHDFHVKYYQGPRTRIALELFWKTPGSNNKVYIPASVMSRP
ncbi:MAG: hypothetical protein H7318_12955 [Oligoflexus sp.]|nr:hypothetical protein [Oligoflexus sp.]